ncbi:MAG: isoamylase early set domain-containing protein [Acidiferrobacter sp.]
MRDIDNSLTEAEVDSALKRLPAPVVAPQFADNVMRAIESRRSRNVHVASRKAWVWAVAAAVTVLVTAGVLRMGRAPTLPPGTKLVRFAVRLPGAQRVALVGSFNGWGRRIALRSGRHGLWTVRVPLRLGQYTYVFVVNGHRILPDPHAEGYRPDGFGGKNSLIIVGSRGVFA